MPIYTVVATMELFAETEHEAYAHVRAALEHSRTATIDHLDSEVVSQRSDVEEV